MQLFPDWSQSCHLLVKEVGLPVQEPLLVDIVWPCVAVPVTTGVALLVGAGGGEVVVLPVTYADTGHVVQDWPFDHVAGKELRLLCDEDTLLQGPPLRSRMPSWPPVPSIATQ